MISLAALLFAALIALSAALTQIMMTWSIIDTPTSRSSHQRPTPRTGGIAIAISCLIGWIMVYLLVPERDVFFRIAPLQFSIYVAIAAGVFLSSLADDIWGLKPLVKFLIQLIAALLFVSFVATFRELSIPGFGVVQLTIWGSVLAVLWMIFFMNAFNFMDGINGLAGGIAFIACLCLAVMGIFKNAHLVTLTSLCLAASTIGFLRYNFSSGRVFMGDSGSQFIGFVIASLAIFGASLEINPISPYFVPILLAPFIFDVLVTLIYRAARKENVLMAHREHLYQIGTKLGAGHTQVSVVYFILTGISGAVAFFADIRPTTTALWLVIALMVMLGILAFAIYRAGLRAGVVEPLGRARSQAEGQ